MTALTRVLVVGSGLVMMAMAVSWILSMYFPQGGLGMRPTRNERIVEAAIKAGPDCVCGHARCDHRTKMWFDGRCQVPECSTCQESGYRQPGGYVPPAEVFE